MAEEGKEGERYNQGERASERERKREGYSEGENVSWAGRAVTAPYLQFEVYDGC